MILENYFKQLHCVIQTDKIKRMTFFKNKVIWITGASSGIGAAMAQYFAKAGSRLILSARRKTQLEEVKESCGLPDADVLVLP